MNWNFVGTEKQIKWAEDIVNREMAKLDEAIREHEAQRDRMIAILRKGGNDATSYERETNINCDRLVACRKAREHLISQLNGASAKDIIENRYMMWDGVLAVIRYYQKEREKERQARKGN